MTNKERESIIERMINKELRKTKAYCYVWIKTEKIKVDIYRRKNLPVSSPTCEWVKTYYYDKSVMNGSDEEIAVQILLDFTFNTGR